MDRPAKFSKVSEHANTHKKRRERPIGELNKEASARVVMMIRIRSSVMFLSARGSRGEIRVAIHFGRSLR